MTATLPIQRRLDITVRLNVPLFDVSMSRAVLDCSAKEVIEHISERRINWAWDIGLGGKRKEWRVLAKSARGLYTTSVSDGLEDAPPLEIIGWILARDKKPVIDATRLEELFIGSGHLIYDLIAAGELKLVPGSDAPRRGRGGSAAISKESVVNFLKRRKQ